MRRNETLRCVVVLSALALISGLLLGFFNSLTALTPEDILQRTQKKISSIYALEDLTELDASDDENISGFFRGKSEGKTVYVIIANGRGGFGGKVQMYVFLTDDEIVRMGAGTHGETPGTSDKALSGTHFAQYYNKNVLNGEFTLGGEGDYGVDAATGATYTSTGISNAVKNAVNFYKTCKEEGILDAA